MLLDEVGVDGVEEQAQPCARHRRHDRREGLVELCGRTEHVDDALELAGEIGDSAVAVGVVHGDQFTCLRLRVSVVLTGGQL